MYPFLRMTKELALGGRARPLTLHEPHLSHHICWPWDLDFWGELNNGRTLTLYDLGRVPMAQRFGLLPVLRKRKWGLTVAGLSIRYRRRVRAFDRVILHTRMLGWDDRFLYLEQGMSRKRDGEALNHALLRTAITGKTGIVAPAEMAQELGWAPTSPPLPDWITHWIAAEAERPWPPPLFSYRNSSGSG